MEGLGRPTTRGEERRKEGRGEARRTEGRGEEEGGKGRGEGAGGEGRGWEERRGVEPMFYVCYKHVLGVL